MDALDADMKNGDVAVLTIWNNASNVLNAYHTFAVQKKYGQYYAYNRNNDDKTVQRFKTWGSLFEYDEEGKKIGSLIAGYKLS
jgi:bisphosphoglycerate-independent phosphoglycerate mutase (AlkP superfamily)